MGAKVKYVEESLNITVNKLVLYTKNQWCQVSVLDFNHLVFKQLYELNNHLTIVFVILW